MSKICSFCNSEVEDNAKFCMFCGNPVKDINVSENPVQLNSNTENGYDTVNSDVNLNNEDVKNDENYFDLGAEPKFDDSVFESSGNSEDSQENTYSDSYASNEEFTYKQNAPKTNGNTGFSIASLVLGILSLVCCCIGYLAILFAVASIVFGIISIKNNNENKGLAIAGIICSGIALVIYFIILIFVGVAAIMDNSVKMDIEDAIINMFDSI